MEVFIETSDPDAVSPREVAEALTAAGWYVRLVNVNEGERVWEEER